MWNKARKWGYTDKENPCAGIKGYRKYGRDTYITGEDYNAVWNAADESLKNALDLAYLTGQRVADVLKMKAEDIINGELHIRQNKTRTKLRAIIEGKLKTCKLARYFALFCAIIYTVHLSYFAE